MENFKLYKVIVANFYIDADEYEIGIYRTLDDAKKIIDLFDPFEYEEWFYIKEVNQKMIDQCVSKCIEDCAKNREVITYETCLDALRRQLGTSYYFYVFEITFDLSQTYEKSEIPVSVGRSSRVVYKELKHLHVDMQGNYIFNTVENPRYI